MPLHGRQLGVLGKELEQNESQTGRDMPCSLTIARMSLPPPMYSMEKLPISFIPTEASGSLRFQSFTSVDLNIKRYDSFDQTRTLTKEILDRRENKANFF